MVMFLHDLNALLMLRNESVYFQPMRIFQNLHDLNTSNHFVLLYIGKESKPAEK